MAIVNREIIFSIRCRGRDAESRKVLSKPVPVKISVGQRPMNEESIYLKVGCPYNTGGHGQRCKASHPNVDKVGEGVGCPYAADIPYAFDKHSS